jgi:hypothetical protein
MSVIRLANWWKRFKQRHIADYDHRLWSQPERPPYAAEILPHVECKPRVVPCPFWHANGKAVDGWFISAQNDAARVEVLIAWIRSLNRRRVA